MTKPIVCNVIDAGARYGIHPTWKELQDLVNFHLFEMEENEANRLKEMYADRPNISVHAYALYKTEGILKYKLRKHKGLISLYDNNTDFLQSNRYFTEESEYEEERETVARTIDSMFADTDIHFLKIDTEGAELDVLKGAESKLGTTVLGVRAEVNFEEIYKGIPLFGEIHTFMQKNDFVLLNLDYDGRGHHMSSFTMPSRYGYLIDSEAVWIKKVNKVLSQEGDRLSHDVVIMSMFLLHNNATDIAIDLLLQAVEKKQVDLTSLREDPVFSHLKRKVAFLFKNLLSLPNADAQLLYSSYVRIFDEEFPRWDKFYETFSC